MVCGVTDGGSRLVHLLKLDLSEVVCMCVCVGVGSTRAVSVTTNLPLSVAGGNVWTAPHVSAASLPHPARYAGSKTGCFVCCLFHLC